MMAIANTIIDIAFNSWRTKSIFICRFIFPHALVLVLSGRLNDGIEQLLSECYGTFFWVVLNPRAIIANI